MRTKRPKGIKSTLYDARSTTSQLVNNEKLDKLMSSLKTENPRLPALVALNQNATHTIDTQFGEMPLGSLLSIHLPLIPPDFNIHCSTNLSVNTAFEFYTYPPFPINNNENKINSYLENISMEKIQFLEKLKITKDDVDKIEQRTRLQADEPEWFNLRKNRLTASLNNKIHDIKTERGFKTLAINITRNTKPNKFLQYKPSFGRYHEPIALQHYEKFMKSKQHHIQVENVGLVIDYENYVLGATPDGKVVDPSEISPYGSIEIKCSEEYKNNDPRDICYISKSSCLEIINDNIYLKRNHSYFDQIQMQLALTTKSWCDFILYTNKGMVVDRIRYDENHWFALREKLLNFYFHFLLDEYLSVNRTI